MFLHLKPFTIYSIIIKGLFDKDPVFHEVAVATYSMITLISILHLGSAARCPENTFPCDNGECVTKLNPECDFVSDCADESDEARCGE